MTNRPETPELVALRVAIAQAVAGWRGDQTVLCYELISAAAHIMRLGGLDEMGRADAMFEAVDAALEAQTAFVSKPKH